MIEVDKFFFVIPLGRVSGDDPAVVATSGRSGGARIRDPERTTMIARAVMML